MGLLTVLLALVGAAIASLVAYQTAFLFLGLCFRNRHLTDRRPSPRSRFVVLVPAHNESKLIAQSVESIVACDYPRDLFELIVIADNCIDDTAVRARHAGATVFERDDLTQRGKPFALNWAISRLDLDRYDAIVIVDADTAIDRHFLRAMDAHLAEGEQAIQGFFGVANHDENWLTRLSVLPASVKFRLHFPGKRALGLSCPLAGNGMCFSVDVIRRFGWRAFSITENWEYYVMLTLQGVVTTSAPEAIIYSQVARSLKLGETQRLRWMKGQIETLARYWRPLLIQGLRESSVTKLDALIELVRPSHANLVFVTFAYLTLCVVLRWFGLDMQAWLVLAFVLLALQALYFLIGLALERPPLRTWLALANVPWYIAWKLGVSLRGLLTLSDRTWIKTDRN
jgi:cellulose synthase/poly-beta-1,6-N-acetylglucosamine synthase-like glycosyltransferase